MIKVLQTPDSATLDHIDRDHVLEMETASIALFSIEVVSSRSSLRIFLEPGIGRVSDSVARKQGETGSSSRMNCCCDVRGLPSGLVDKWHCLEHG